jgi:hypothetical protein
MCIVWLKRTKRSRTSDFNFALAKLNAAKAQQSRYCEEATAKVAI